MQDDPAKAVKDKTQKSRKGKGESILSLKRKITFLIGFLCLGPYFILLSTTKLTKQVGRAILINGVMSIGGFFLIVVLVPVASNYLLRKEMFGSI